MQNKCFRSAFDWIEYTVFLIKNLTIEAAVSQSKIWTVMLILSFFNFSMAIALTTVIEFSNMFVKAALTSGITS